MKKNITLLCCIVATCLFTKSKAQSFTAEWGGETVFTKKGYEINSIIGHDSNNYYALSQDVNHADPFTIMRYDMKHDVEQEFVINMLVKGREAEWESIHMLNNHFVVFMSLADGKEGKNTLYACTITKDGRQSAPEAVDHITIKNLRKTGAFYIYLSDDKTKLLVMHLEAASGDREDKEKLNYRMFNDKLELLWEKPVELTYKDEDFTVSTCRIDEQGNVFMLGWNRPENQRIQYKLLAYYHQANRLQEVDLSFANVYTVGNLRFRYISGHLLLLAFYTHAGKDGFQGVVYTKLNALTLQTETDKTLPFTRTDLYGFISESAAQNGKGIPLTYITRDIVILPNGETKIIAENYEVFNNGGNSNTAAIMHYAYDDIMVVGIAPDAAGSWMARISKRQWSTSDRGLYSSYMLAYDNNNLYILFNDNPKNTAPDTKKENRGTYRTHTEDLDDLSVTLAKVNNRGEVSTEYLFNSRTNTITAVKPKMHYRLSSDKLLMHGVRKNQYKFGILSVK